MNALIIAPGMPADRTWVKADPLPSRVIIPRESVALLVAAMHQGVIASESIVPTATLQLREIKLPGWLPVLPIYVLDSIRHVGDLPDCYVLPGLVKGARLERELIDHDPDWWLE